ncbi:MAG: hypothetical protein KDE20_15425 [Caldilineaceae bacterium]|nr:hypothetical protein [Caldilineaceae bacterium]
MTSDHISKRITYGFPHLLGNAPTIRESSLTWTPVSEDEYGGIVSSGEEIRRAVERNAISRGILFVEIMVDLDLDDLFSRIDDLAQSYDKEDFWEQGENIGVATEALEILDQSIPPIPYTNFFCRPELFIVQPDLVFYYRNIALLSDKVMKGIGLHVTTTEARRGLSHERAVEIATYLNRVVSGLIIATGVSPRRHIEMLMANVGESLGGSSRNEVGRVAVAQALRPVILELWRRDLLESITFSTRADLVPGSSREQEETVTIHSETEIEEMLDRVEAQFVKYQSIQLRTGALLLVDKIINWSDSEGRRRKASADLHSLEVRQDAKMLLWAAEVKGGADPAGSDEHWKTASRALRRIIEEAESARAPQPPLSFIGTTIVGRVGNEIRQWIDRGDLISAYNLTKILEQADYRQRYVDEILRFLGSASRQ